MVPGLIPGYVPLELLFETASIYFVVFGDLVSYRELI